MKKIKRFLKKILPHGTFIFLKRLNKARHAFINEYKSFTEFNMPDLVLSVGQACNFKCRDCGNFAPFAPAEYMRYKLENIKNDISQILKAVKKLDAI